MLGIPKKTLDDYQTIIKKGVELNFDFVNNED